MKTFNHIDVLVAIGVLFCVGCSKENRDEIITRIGKAGKALNGEVRPNDVEHDIPNIVHEQQCKERIRQNTTWTAENRALHPKEYCQSQLDVLNGYAAQLDVSMHKLLVKQSTIKSAITDTETQIAHFTNALMEAKNAFRASRSNSIETIAMGGYNLSLSRAKEKMVLMNKRVPVMRAKIETERNALNQIAKSIDRVEREQEKVVLLREKVQTTLDELRLKDVIEGDKSIVVALDAINHNLAGLGVDYDDPSIEAIITPSSAQMIDAEFEKLMSE